MEEKNKRKKYYLICGIIFTLFIIFNIFLLSTYNFSKNGNNNINKSEEEIIDNILNIKAYSAIINVEIETNKNKNKYVIKQIMEKERISRQEVLEPSNLTGIITEYDGKNLKITNNNLKLTKTYENYTYVVDNRLWLDSFIEDYKNYDNRKKETKDNEIILEVKNEKDNKYNVYKKLYISKKHGKPTKLVIQDINQKTLVYILYKEIEIS